MNKIAIYEEELELELCQEINEVEPDNEEELTRSLLSSSIKKLLHPVV